MSSDIQEIEQAIRSLPRPEVEQLWEWLENFLEDQLALTDEFKASIERGENDIITRNRNAEILRLTPIPAPRGDA
jgi:hypothetical protein